MRSNSSVALAGHVIFETNRAGSSGGEKCGDPIVLAKLSDECATSTRTLYGMCARIWTACCFNIEYSFRVRTVTSHIVGAI